MIQDDFCLVVHNGCFEIPLIFILGNTVVADTHITLGGVVSVINSASSNDEVVPCLSSVGVENRS